MTLGYELLRRLLIVPGKYMKAKWLLSSINKMAPFLLSLLIFFFIFSFCNGPCDVTASDKYPVTVTMSIQGKSTFSRDINFPDYSYPVCSQQLLRGWKGTIEVDVKSLVDEIFAEKIKTAFDTISKTGAAYDLIATIYINDINALNEQGKCNSIYLMDSHAVFTVSLLDNNRQSVDSFQIEGRCNNVRGKEGVHFFGLGERSHLESQYKTALNCSIEKAADDLMDGINSSDKIKMFSSNTVKMKALPSDLAINITPDSFSDAAGFFPNKILDAGENAEINFTITNTGKGAGFGTVLDITSDNPKIAYEKQINIGDILPNEKKEIKIPIKAALDIGDGNATFQFNLREKRNYDARKVALKIPTARLEKPSLEIVNTEINNGDTGLAHGSGDGIIKSGETIELIVFIKNTGAGRALGVNLYGTDTTSGIQWVRNSTLIGAIQPGEIVKAKLAFAVPRNFDAKEIITGLKATDIRDVSTAEKKQVYAFAKRSPVLNYAYQVYSKGTQVNSVINGEEYEIELTLNNSGQMPARDVALSLTARQDVKLSHSRIDIGDVKEKSSTAQKITMSVPRTFVEAQVPLNIEIKQSDFPSTRYAINIPVNVKSPRLTYKTNLLSKNGGNNLEQGEQAILELMIVNDGSLPAEGVRVKLESKGEDLKLIGQTEALIGKVPAGTTSETVKFQLSTFRRIKIGDAYLSVNITQADFQPVLSQYALNIREEGVTVVDSGADERTKISPLVSKAQAGPAIAVKSPMNAGSTSEESIRLAFEVSDSRNVESVKVSVNGNVVLAEKPALRKKDVVRDVSLQEGENTIVITAYNSDNLLATKEIKITRAGEDDVDTPPLTKMSKPDAVAVVIGISKYKNEPPVNYAKRDAQTVKKYLVSTLGYDEKRIIELYDEEADRTSIVASLYDDLEKRIVSGKSDVFIYFSGHGMPDVDSKEAEKDPYIAPYDFRQSAIKRTGVSLKELYQQLEQLKARSVTMVMDSCFSGVTEKGSLITGISAVLEVSNPMLKAKDAVIFTASSSKEAAHWYDKKQHGLFTYYFLLGLRGKADTNGDGVITKKKLEEYVKRNVTEHSQYRQNPTAVGNPDSVIVTFK